MSAIDTTVRDFYEEIPFNLRESVEKQASGNVQSHDLLALFPFLKDGNFAGKRILDVGCGAGWAANYMAHHFHCEVVGLDFTAAAIARARDVAAHLGNGAMFEHSDIFTFVPDRRFDVVISNGVLHHTKDFAGALERCCTHFLAEDGIIGVGLYHKYGRAPFLDHFAGLKQRGMSEDALFAEYARLHSTMRDKTQLRSWFRDQVLHPHETQHTLEEVVDIYSRHGISLTATSINRFKPFSTLTELYEAEPGWADVGKSWLREGRYFPGFFTAIGTRGSARL